MNNFSVKKDGKVYWVSRSMAVTGFVFKRIGLKMFVLVNKRGEGAPDFKHHWNCPCGYLDYNETTKEAVSREVREETGIDITPQRFIFTTYRDNPETENRQNVTFRFYTVLSKNEGNTFSLDESEENEVEEVKWIEVKNVQNYLFAFNHSKAIKEVYKNYKLKIWLKSFLTDIIYLLKR